VLRRLLLIIPLAAPAAAAAQGDPATPYAIYAAAIAAKADNAIEFLTAETDSVASEIAVGMLTTGASQMRPLINEFAMTQTPAELAVAHRDLVAALNVAAATALHAATLLATAMDTTVDDDQRTIAAMTAQKELQDLKTAITGYRQARARTALVLQRHGVALPAGP